MIRAALLNQPSPSAERTVHEPGAAESALESASRRLHAAIDALEAAVHRRLEHEGSRDDLEAQLQAYGSDRSRLAEEMDRLRARAVDLESVNREVSRRLDHAVATIRTVLEPHEH
jgi:chromosome segregation ATPase